MEVPESSVGKDSPRLLSLKQSIRLSSKSRTRVEDARELDAQVNEKGPTRGKLLHPSKEVSRSRRSSEADVSKKYKRRQDDAFGPAKSNKAIVRHETEREMAEKAVDAEEKSHTTELGWRIASDGVQEIVLESYSHYIDMVTRFQNIYNDVTERYNTKAVCKGSASRDTGIESDLLRGYNPASNASVESVEAGWIRGFMAGPPPQVSQHTAGSCRSNVWALLSLMKQSGYPTRLVEWSFNPNVALYYAIEDFRSMHVDGEVWLVMPSELYQRQSSGISEAPSRGNMHYPTALQYQELTGAISAERPEDDPVVALRSFERVASSSDGSAGLSFLEPMHIDKRMINQASVYAVSSDATVGMESVLRSNPSCARRVIVPCFLKRILLQTLNLVGIHRRWLFPSGEIPPSRSAFEGACVSPGEVRMLLKKRYFEERDKKIEDLLIKWNQEKSLRQNKHHEKCWPLLEECKLAKRPLSSPSSMKPNRLLN